MAAAAALRLWDLDAKALHHDESLHATFSWYLYDGRGYIHDPLMHGPFQFNMNALSFFLFGVTDFTPRLLSDAALLQPLRPRGHLRRFLDAGYRRLPLALPGRTATAVARRAGRI